MVIETFFFIYQNLSLSLYLFVDSTSPRRAASTRDRAKYILTVSIIHTACCLLCDLEYE